MRTLDRAEARQIAVRAALLDATPPSDLVGVIHGLAALRVEHTAIVAEAHDHVPWTRLGAATRPGEALDLLRAGVLFERNWYLRPLSDLGLFLGGMRTWATRSGFAGWMAANDHFRRAIRDRIADLGPLTSRDIPDEAAVPWQSTGWRRDRNVTQMLEGMHGAGELAVVGRVGRLRVWDLAENVYPSDIVEVPAAEARRIRSERLLAASGIVPESIAVWTGEIHDLEIVGEPVTIDGVAGRWRVDPAQLDRPFTGRTAILSPFDRLVGHRDRVRALFDVDVAVEMFKPAAARRWGPFALPVLRGDRLVAKVEARAERSARELHLVAVHEDERLDADARDAIRGEVASLATFLGLELVDAS